MSVIKYLKDNAMWRLGKENFDFLFAPSVTKAQLFDMLKRGGADSKVDGECHIDTNVTEFCLNSVALAPAKRRLSRAVKELFPSYWQTFVRLKNVFGKNYMTFPSSCGMARLEKAVRTVVLGTQFCFEAEFKDELKRAVEDCYQLNERESAHFEDMMSLYRCNYYCMAAAKVFSGDVFGEKALARLVGGRSLVGGMFVYNAFYSKTSYEADKLYSALDCIGNSAAVFFGITPNFSVSLRLISGKRNLFDTFCYHKFGKYTSEFHSDSKAFSVSMQFFLREGCEIRRYTVENKSSRVRKTTFEFALGGESVDSGEYFEHGGAHCFGITGNKSFYAALVLLKNSEILPSASQRQNGRTNVTFDISSGGGEKVFIDAVTVYAKDMASLMEKLNAVCRFGGTNCDKAEDSPCEGSLYSEKIALTSANGLIDGGAAGALPRALEFSYQFGTPDCATLLGNDGNAATLIKGFAFGTGGESLYVIANGKAEKLNFGAFEVTLNGWRYKRFIGKTECTANISHGTGKNYNISLSSKARALLYFPFEEYGEVTYADGHFTVDCGRRKFFVVTMNAVESYTVNAVECNSMRLRYKLSDSLGRGKCLAVCFAPSLNVSVSVTSSEYTAADDPLIKESLLSTYLNYVNDKNMFCLNNKLKKADALTVAALNFTNAAFVKKYIAELTENSYAADYRTEFYDKQGKLAEYFDPFIVTLAALYYAALTNDKSILSGKVKDLVHMNLFYERADGRALCVKALALRKLAQISDDKVDALVEYAEAKKKIIADKSLYKYAQAIGAVPFYNPSKQRLKDICNEFGIPKSWYYVSQLENLYGVNLNCGKLSVRPQVSAENELEKFALYYKNKRIETSFTRAAVQSMSVNGVTCFQSFAPDSLKSEINTLEVRY